MLTNKLHDNLVAQLAAYLAKHVVAILRNRSRF